jgi:hypothetical protein
MDSILYTNFYGVPIMTYGMIGATTFALAYFTLTDVDTKSTTESNPLPPPLPESEQPAIIGGGKGSGKKTKRHIKKSKQSKKNLI